MSKFLGPVHFWLYRKIQFQESLIDALISYAVQEGWNDEDLTRYSCQDRRQLDEIIDETNIHGWLQARIQDAEKRYAALVLHLVGSDETRLSALKQAAVAFGATQNLSASTAPEAFHRLDDLLLDGMPCDQINRVSQSSDDAITWIQSADIHSVYWQDRGHWYYQLRQALITGLLSHTSYSFLQKEDGSFHIVKKAA